MEMSSLHFPCGVWCVVCGVLRVVCGVVSGVAWRGVVWPRGSLARRHFGPRATRFLPISLSPHGQRGGACGLQGAAAWHLGDLGL
eukprot:2124603-Alexandrium_andersonii.AAC.1